MYFVECIYVGGQGGEGGLDVEGRVVVGVEDYLLVGEDEFDRHGWFFKI